MKQAIDRLVAAQQARQLDLNTRALNALWNRVYTVIRSIPGHSLEQHHRFCAELEATPVEQRPEVILARYGQTCLDKCKTLLQQIAAMPTNET